MSVIQIKGVSGTRDRRGLQVLNFSFFIPGVSAEQALVARLPSVSSFPEVFRSIQEWDVDNNGFTIMATFEGLIGEPDESQDQFSIDAEWREEPIEAFPELDALMEKYAGYYNSEGRVEFRPRLENEGSGGGSGLFDSGTTATGKNPLFGQTTYPVLRLVATRSRVRRTVPSTVYTNVGKVIKSLPVGFKDPPARTWITDVPKTRKRGNVWEITERWKDVKDLQHLDAIYTLLRR